MESVTSFFDTLVSEKPEDVTHWTACNNISNIKFVTKYLSVHKDGNHCLIQ